MIRVAQAYARAIGDRSSGGVVTGCGAQRLCQDPRINHDAIPNTGNSKDLRVMKTKKQNRRTRQIRYRIRQSIALPQGVSTGRVQYLCFFSQTRLPPQLFSHDDVRNDGLATAGESSVATEAEHAWLRRWPIFLQNQVISIIINLAEKAGNCCVWAAADVGFGGA
jgi:hypothetical protein